MSEAIIASLLIWFFNSKIFRGLRAVKLDEWSAVASREARVIANAELVELPSDKRQFLTIRAEADGEFTALLLKVDKRPPEGWDQVIFTFTKHGHESLFLNGKFFGRRIIVRLLFLLIISGALFDFLLIFPKRLTLLNLIGNFRTKVKLILGAAGQAECPLHFFVGVFELRAEAAGSCKAAQSVKLDGYVLLCVWRVVGWVILVEEVFVGDDVD